MTTNNTFVDYSNKLNNLKSEIIASIIALLDNRRYIDLIPYVRDNDGEVEFRGDKSELPYKMYTNGTLGGECAYCSAYRLENHFGVWMVRWNDTDDHYNDYITEHETAEQYAEIPHFAGCEINELTLLYNRVYKLVSNEITLDTEQRKWEEERAKEKGEYVSKLLERLENAIKNNDERDIKNCKKAILAADKSRWRF